MAGFFIPDGLTNSIKSKGLSVDFDNSYRVCSSSSIYSLKNIQGKIGTLIGFKVLFSHESGVVRLTCDGNIVFELSCTNLKSMQFDKYSDVGLVRWFGSEQYGSFEFYPSAAISFKSNMKIELLASVSWDIQILNTMVYLYEQN